MYKLFSMLFSPQTEVEGRRVPTKIKLLSSSRVVGMILGRHHSAVLVEPGVLYTFGRNTDGQLGVGNTKPREAPMQVKDMSDKVIMVSPLVYNSSHLSETKLTFRCFYSFSCSHLLSKQVLFPSRFLL